MGQYTCNTWYYSPYPKEYHHIDTLYICEFCLNFYVDTDGLIRHSRKCRLRHPPGDEIYRDGNVSVFEVDGKLQPHYCENLCWHSKLFLDHKTLYYNCDIFLFYVLTEFDERGYHVMGYFSKEKDFESGGNNLSCILVFPFQQRKGYGKFLIAFSYELCLLEGKEGTPERPLSDLGHKSYFSWWTWRILNLLLEYRG